QIDFEFIDHELSSHVDDGRSRRLVLEPQSVANFYRRVMAMLAELELPVKIKRKPNEVADVIPFDQDERHKTYDAEAAARFWRVLVQVDRVFKEFRSRFVGKCSPVHLFWGAGDLAVTRLSGRRAPTHPGGIPNMPDDLIREAYSHECSSVGFWPGGEQAPYPFVFAYAYPAPAGFAEAKVLPAQARFAGPDGARQHAADRPRLRHRHAERRHGDSRRARHPARAARGARADRPRAAGARHHAVRERRADGRLQPRPVRTAGQCRVHRKGAEGRRAMGAPTEPHHHALGRHEAPRADRKS